MSTNNEENKMSIDDLFRIYFQDFDLKEILKEDELRRSKELVMSIVEGLREDVEAALKKVA